MAARFALIVLFVLPCFGCRTAPTHAKRLGVLGGLAGAAAGAAIGAEGGDAVPGALIGGAIGAVSGTAIGSAADAEDARNRAFIEEQIGRRLANAVSIPEVIEMSHAGLSDMVIISHVRAHPIATQLNSSDLIALKNQGVSDAVIAVLQEPPLPQTVVRPASAPVIVEEHYYGPPCFGPRYYHRHYRPRCGTSWGISFSN